MEMNTYTQGDSAVVAIRGRFDAHTVPALKQWLVEVTAAQRPYVIVNLSETTFIDTPALSALVNGMKHCREKDGDLVLCDLQDPVRIIFELTRLDKAFQIHPDEAAALAGATA